VRGWAGRVDIVREKDYDNSELFQTLSEDLLNRTGRTGGTFPAHLPHQSQQGEQCSVPAHLQSTYNYNNEINDLTA